MKLTIERAALLRSLNHVQSVVERRNTIPILSNVHFNVHENRLAMTATDMDLAIMGQSNSVGAVTAIYENKEGSFEDTNQNFTKVYDGDLSWVDLNKDGWLDLVVTGYNESAKTNIYINNEGQTFETSTACSIPRNGDRIYNFLIL